MDRFHAVKLFVRIVELGSFSKAAAEFGIGQPTATKQVAQMEQQLQARLLHRSTHGVTPTEIGALYYEKCRLIAHHVDEAQSLAALMKSQLRGELRITTSAAFGRRVLAPLVMDFMARHEGLQVDMSVDDRYVNLIEQGMDLAIRMGRLSDSTLGARFLGLNPWVIVASPAYLERCGTPRTPADVAAHAALVYSTVQGDARWHLAGPRGQAETVTVGGSLRSNNLSVLLLGAERGLGIAALPRYVAEGSLRRGGVTPILSDWTFPPQEIHAVFPSPRMVPAKVSGLADWLQERFQGEWWAR